MTSGKSMNSGFVVAVSTILALASANAQSATENIDPQVYDVHPAPFTMNNYGVMIPLWNTIATVFREGEKVGFHCNAGILEKGDEKYNFPIYFYVDGALVAQVSRKDNLEATNRPVWTATGVGTHTLECRMQSNVGSKANDSANTAFVVKPYVAGEPGVLYTQSSFSGPKITSIQSGQKFVLRPDLKISVEALIGSASYFVSYTKSSPYDELWHIEIVRRGSGKMSAAETLVTQDSGVISTSKFGTTLGEWFMVNAGAGLYAARTYLSQKRPDGYFVGTSDRVEFEVVAPLTLGNAGLQVVQSSPAAASGSAAPPERAAQGGSTQRVAAAASSVIGQMSRAAPVTKFFEPPLVDGKRVDLCLHWGSDCGQPAADAFCQKSGFSKAAEFKEAYDIGAQSPTLVLGDGKLCAEAYCDGFAMIRCTN